MDKDTLTTIYIALRAIRQVLHRVHMHQNFIEITLLDNKLEELNNILTKLGGNDEKNE